MNNASKNCAMFFGTATIGVIAVFVFSASPAHAYAVGPATPSTGSGSYDFGSSLQNLTSPFTEFVNSLNWNNSTTTNPSGANGGINGTNFAWPTVNITPVLESNVQNVLSQWLSQFDDWFYRTTGVQLSGIIVATLSLFSWALGLAQQVVNWLLGLFH
jgi:hypothetical protein